MHTTLFNFLLELLACSLRLLLRYFHRSLAAERVEHTDKGVCTTQRLVQFFGCRELEEVGNFLPSLLCIGIQLVDVSTKGQTVENKSGLSSHACCDGHELQRIRRHIRQHGIEVLAALQRVISAVLLEKAPLLGSEVFLRALAITDYCASFFLPMLEPVGQRCMGFAGHAGYATPSRHRNGIPHIAGVDAVYLGENQSIEP